MASQIPCRFCLAADTEFAKLEGATEREIDEAIAMAALTRHWSTYFNGMQTDEAAFKRDIDKIVRNVKKQMAAAKKVAASAGKAEPAAAATMTAAANTETQGSSTMRGGRPLGCPPRVGASFLPSARRPLRAVKSLG